MLKLKEIYNIIDSHFPFCEAESWDNSGLLVESEKDINKVLISLDATCDVISEAERKGCELIISHHPVIFNPLKALCDSEPAVLALKKGISIISAHTNYDVSSCGADALLSLKLSEYAGFSDEGYLEITQNTPAPHGFGRFGTLSKSYTQDEFAAVLKKIFNCAHLRAVKGKEEIKKVAFCCGGGSEYLEKATQSGYDAYITSDVKHSGFIFAKNSGISLFAPTHYQMEKAAMNNLADILKENTNGIEIYLSESESEPSQIL